MAKKVAPKNFQSFTLLKFFDHLKFFLVFYPKNFSQNSKVLHPKKFFRFKETPIFDCLHKVFSYKKDERKQTVKRRISFRHICFFSTTRRSLLPLAPPLIRDDSHICVKKFDLTSFFFRRLCFIFFRKKS